MKSAEFCYWLQGLFELAEPATLNARQTDLIRRHLDMVFEHEIAPSPNAKTVSSIPSNPAQPDVSKLWGTDENGISYRC